MAKYKMKSLSVQIAGVLYKKSDKVIFDTEKKFKRQKDLIEAAHKAGFLEKLKDNKNENSKK